MSCCGTTAGGADKPPPRRNLCGGSVPANESDPGIRRELDRIYQASGIDAASMDPSSARYLRDWIAHEQKRERKQRAATVVTAAAPKTPTAANPAAANATKKASSPATTLPETKTGSEATSPTTIAASATTTKASPESRKKQPPLETVTKKAAAAAAAAAAEEEASAPESTPPLQPVTSAPISSTKLSVPLSNWEAASFKLTAAASCPPATTKDDETGHELPSVELPPSAVGDALLRIELQKQRRVMQDQAEVLSLLAAHIKDLTDTVQTLQSSVQTLQQHPQQPQSQQSQSQTPWRKPPPASSLPASHPAWGAPDHPATPRNPEAAEPAAPPDAINHANAIHNILHANNNNNNNNNANEFRRAHNLAHHVAWRIATFPIRALVFYLKYEYRIWLCLYRLARRDVLNPFREAGMAAQLFFALLIVYGRIAPALERAAQRAEREQQATGTTGGGGDDDEYYYYGGGENGEDGETVFLDDAETQIQTLVTCVVAGFLYHVGWFGLMYRFFFRDRLHVRIWNDLREGVELTPTYGLDFDTTENDNNNNENENENDNNNDENDNNEENMPDENDNENGNDNNNNHRAPGQGNNNIPVPPNRRPGNQNNNNRGNQDGQVFDIANIIGNGINDFFMGQRHRRQPPDEEGTDGAAETTENGGIGEEPEDNPGIVQRNPVLGLISDVLCLFYSFFVSILPTWNFEQQLRDIRDEEARRLRFRMELEAEALRNQNGSDHESEDGSSSSSSSSSSGSESESESESEEESEDDGSD